MSIICAGVNDYESVRDFYYELTDAMENAKFKPGWKKDVYPSQEYLNILCDFYFIGLNMKGA